MPGQVQAGAEVCEGCLRALRRAGLQAGPGHGEGCHGQAIRPIRTGEKSRIARALFVTPEKPTVNARFVLRGGGDLVTKPNELMLKLGLIAISKQVATGGNVWQRHNPSTGKRGMYGSIARNQEIEAY